MVILRFSDDKDIFDADVQDNIHNFHDLNKNIFDRTTTKHLYNGFHF